MKAFKLLLLFTVIALLHSCSKKPGEDFDSDFSMYKEYVTSFSSGVISTQSDIQVGLAFAKGDWKVNQELDKSLYSISPSVSGKVVVLPGNIIAFKPSKKLEQDTEYKITLHLSEFIEIDKSLADFNFTVKTIKQDFIVVTTDLQSYNKNGYFLNGLIKSSDVMSLDIAKKLVLAQQGDNKLPIRFEGTATASEFHFIIDSIQRKSATSSVKINWNGKDADIDTEGGTEILIPAKDVFKVINIATAPEDSQVLHINFSDPIRKDQDFSGLLAIESYTNPVFTVDGNVLKMFLKDAVNNAIVTPDENNEEAVTAKAKLLLVEVFQGIENTDGIKTKNTYSKKVAFELLKPDVQFIKSGTILPSSSNLKLNFQTVNLSAIDVRVYRIYEDNVMQFLQENNLDGNYNLRRVALPIATKTITLTTNKMLDYSKWNTFALDLSTLIKPQQGAIYRVELTIKRAYSLYNCTGDTEPEEDEDEPVAEEDFSGNGEEYYDYYNYDYDWRDRDNPCTKSFYYNKKIATNILASDLGVIAKRGENNSYFFAVNNILTTDPVAGAKIEIYNYQQQKIAGIETGSEGTVGVTLDKPAFFAIVKKGNNTTYVKLYDGNSQSVSSFDVDGTKLQKGLKGYIYGERGVWRPGDSLYLGFILNDKAAKLPSTHPIKLKLNDPNGRTVFQAVQTYSNSNHYKFIVPTNAAAPTGSWEAVVSVGGARFYKNIKIEAIKPNRLKIKNSFNGRMNSASTQNTARVEVAWLHGAVAKGLKVEMQAKFLNQQTEFKGFKNYVFDDPAQEFKTEEITIFSGVTDESGLINASLQPQLQTRAPGMLKMAIITKAYEKGGDFSTDVVTASYSPYATYIGVKAPQGNKYGMLETGKSNRFDVVAVSEAGRAQGNRQLQVQIFKVDWRWWWDSTGDSKSAYSAALSNTPFFNSTVTTDAAGKANFNLTTDEDQWGNYLVRVTDMQSGHSSGQTVLVDYPQWSGRTRNAKGQDAAMLMFSTDKEKYAVGEKMAISFPSSEGGRALISLENGSKVVKTYWAKTLKGETRVTLPVTENMAPNVYVHITLLQPHANTKNDSPIRLYGIVPVEVVDKNTVLEPQITMPAVLKPEQKTTIKVSEKAGRAMTYTIAIVDDGLLDLTRFKTPNAWNEFYAKEALGVKTWDVYDDVIGAYGGKINQVFSIGGDEDLGNGQAKKANRFKPVVIYLGPYVLPKGQSKSHTITLPKYIGSVRAMVVAANADGSAYGSAEKTVQVKSPLMLLASLPRKVSPGEKVTLPVTLFAMEKNIKNVTLQVKTNKGFRVVGSAVQNVNFTQPDEKVAYFELEAANITGIGKVTVVATSGNEKASYDVEIDIINPNPVTQNYKELILEPGQSGTVNWASFGVPGSNKARLEVSSFPSIDFNRRLDYLIMYPHGCVEQVTSSAFPQLYLADIADIDQARKQKIQKNITAAITKLTQYQVSDGGYTYWPGNGTPDDWGSSYAGHFLIEAEKKGYALPPNTKKQWLSYQSKTARQWRYNEGYHNDLAQAYRLYTLSLAGSPDLSSMNRLRETQGISNESKLRLAAAYALAGQKNAGLSLLSKSIIDENNSPYQYAYYGSPERNRAMALETLILLGQKQKAFDMANKLAKQMSSNQWMSTQSTAYCLYAMSKFAQANGSKGIDMQFTSKGKSQAIKTAKTFADRPLEINGNNAVTIKNNKKGTLYIKVVYSGILPVGQEQEEQRGLMTAIAFKDRGGNVINPLSLAQGTEFVAEVTVANLKGEKVDNVALTKIIPSGWEIVNTRFTDFGEFADNKVDYTDIRDDRTNFYFSLRSQETKTFRVLLNASYPGSYYLPGVQCEAMYDNSFLARTKGQWIQVVR